MKKRTLPKPLKAIEIDDAVKQWLEAGNKPEVVKPGPGRGKIYGLKYSHLHFDVPEEKGIKK
jgi:hypothetical protein